MGGTTLISKGILSPMEGDVVFHETELPLEVEYVVGELDVEIPDVLTTDVLLPDEVYADTSMELLEVFVVVPSLDITAELEE